MLPRQLAHDPCIELGQLCLRHDLVLLTADDDFRHMARVTGLSVWARTTGRH